MKCGANRSFPTRAPVSSEKGEPPFPQVPTVAETAGLESYSAGSWLGIIALPDIHEK